MKKVFLLIITGCLLLSAFSLSAFDIGGAIDNQSAVELEGSTVEASFLQFDKLTLWLESDIGKNFYIGAQGSYTFSLTRYYLFDLELLKFRSEIPLPSANMFLSIDAGRFPVTDFTERVLSHPLDGLNLHMKFPFMNTTLFAGYSGLLFKEPSRIIMSKHDAADRLSNSVLLAPSRLIGMAEFDFFDLFLRQDLMLNYIIQWDFTPETDLTDETKGGKLNTHYIGLGLGGSPFTNFYYDAYGYLGLGTTLSYINGEYVDANILAWMAGASLRWYPEKKLYSRILLDFVIGSGDKDNYTFTEGNTYKMSTLFVPIAGTPRDTVFTPEVGNMMIGTLSYSLKPFAQLGTHGKYFQVEVQGVVYLRPTIGAISEDYNTASDSIYVGTEADLSLNYRPFSDFGVSLNGGVFIPNTLTGGVFLWETQRTVEAKIKLDFSLSF